MKANPNCGKVARFSMSFQVLSHCLSDLKKGWRDKRDCREGFEVEVPDSGERERFELSGNCGTMDSGKVWVADVQLRRPLFDSYPSAFERRKMCTYLRFANSRPIKLLYTSL